MNGAKPRFIAALALWTTTSFAANAGPPALSSFEGMDTNRDGRVSAAEHSAATQKMFAKMDRDGNGRVTAQEMDAAHEAITGKPGATSALSAAQKIKAIDANGDGTLEAKEHQAGSKAMFAKMDANGDGFLSKEEWARGHASLGSK